MSWEKIAFGCIILYLAIALPLHVLNSQALDKCSSACKTEGFDIVVSATGFEEIQCMCLSSHSREEKAITIG